MTIVPGFLQHSYCIGRVGRALDPCIATVLLGSMEAAWLCLLVHKSDQLCSKANSVCQVNDLQARQGESIGMSYST